MSIFSVVDGEISVKEMVHEYFASTKKIGFVMRFLNRACLNHVEPFVHFPTD